MTVRGRLLVLGLQLVVLGGTAFIVTGKPFAADAWFAAGLLAVVLNPQLLEPYFTKPTDLVANSVIGGVLYAVSDRTAAPIGWDLLLVILILSGIVGLCALIFGAGRIGGPLVPLGRAATALARSFSSRVIFSGIFLLSALSASPVSELRFWQLVTCWVIILMLGVPNWQSVFGLLVGRKDSCVSEGTIGPTRLLISAASIPLVGTRVKISSQRISSEGFVVNRIARGSDVWAEVFVSSNALCEQLARAGSLSLVPYTDSRDHQNVGLVMDGSTDERLQFVAMAPLEVGNVVAVSAGEFDVLYQIRWAEIERSTVRGGSHDIIRAYAAQVGRFDSATGRIVRHRWVPIPGSVVTSTTGTVESPAEPPGMLLGSLLGTTVPVFLDVDAACQGHLAILGMTRMGKTTFAARLARELAKSRRVTVVDLTGEWVTRRGFPAYAGDSDDDAVGVSVFEPRPSENPADAAHTYFRLIANKAYTEYKNGSVVPRVLIFDEAHQFVPEPALLGFNAPGREAAQKFGLLMMQVRKYGISVVLISQRTAVVAKSALSQCETLIAFKSVDQTGLEFLEAILGSESKKALPSLGHAEALAFGPAISSDSTAAVRVSS